MIDPVHIAVSGTEKRQIAPKWWVRRLGKSSARQENLVGYLFIAPWLIGFFAFTLIPVFASLYLAFTNYDILTAPTWAGWANFERMFFIDPRFWKAVEATFNFVFIAVPLRLVFAMAVAMLLNTWRKGVSVYRAIYYAPSVVGGSVAVAVKAAFHGRPVMACSYAEESLGGYIPVREAYPEGGYEVASSPYAPGAEGILRKALVSLGRSLRGG